MKGYTKIIVVGICVLFAGIIFLALYDFDSIVEDKWEMWNFTKPICEEMCELNNGFYKSHEVAFNFDSGKHDTLICSCKNVGHTCLKSFCYNGINREFILRRN